MELEVKKLTQAQFEATVSGKKGEYEVAAQVTITNDSVTGIYGGTAKKNNATVLTFSKQGNLSVSFRDYSDFAGAMDAVVDFIASASELKSTAVAGMEVSEIEE